MADSSLSSVICGLLANYNPMMAYIPPENELGLFFGKELSERSYHPLISNKKDDSYERGRTRIGDARRQRYLYLGRGRRLDGCIAVSVFVFILALVCLTALSLLPWTVIDHSFANVPPNIANLRFIEVQKVCITANAPIHQWEGANETQQCRSVVDIIDQNGNSARRSLFFNGIFDDFESQVSLIRPNGASAANSDTRLWLVDHTVLLNEYVAAMALMPWVVGALGGTGEKFDARADSVLVIGLGGGSLDMFLHTKFPLIDITVYELDTAVIELAEQWFYIINDQRRRTVAGDGISAIEKYAENGTRFNAIIVDACGPSKQISCPSAQFITLNSLRSAKSTLKPIGALVMNVLPAKETDEEVMLVQVQRALSAVFPLCVRMRMGRQLNAIFTCLPFRFEQDDLSDIVQLWQRRKDELSQRFHFQKLLNGTHLSIEVS